MFNNKKMNILLSVLIAIALWIYVVGEINPVTSKTFRELPINYLNEEYLSDNGMAIASVSHEHISVTVEGDRARISKLSPSDISATVDLTDSAKGKNEFKIDVKTIDKISVENKNVDKVVVKIETLVTAEKEIQVVYSGSDKSLDEPITISNDTEKVTISGAKSNVAKVKSVKAEIDVNHIDSKEKTFNVSLVPVDSHGKIVKHISLSKDEAVINAVLGKTKDVELEVPITGSDAGGKEKSVNAPKSITIKGRKDVIDSIDKITAETIDISNVTGSMEIDIIPILPQGVEVSTKTSELKATITVVELESKSFTFETEDVKFSGLGSNLKASVNGNVTVTVSGKKSHINQINKGDIILTADVDGLNQGEYRIDIIASLAKEHSRLVIEPNTIDVIIEGI